MCDVLSKCCGADVVFDDIGGQNDAVARLSGELPHHKILRQVVFEPVEAADRLEHAAPGHDRWAHCKVHPLDHSRDQGASPEVGIHTGCFEARPNTGSGHCTVGTGCDSDIGILKLGGHGAQEVWSDADITVAHHHQIVCRG